MTKTKKVFRSRISVLITLILLVLLTPVVLLNEPHLLMYPIVGLLFLVLIFAGNRYIITGDKLYVKALSTIPYRIIKISNIASIKRSYNPLSSPAASLKRLSISLKNGRTGVLISPIREDEFIEELKAINPDIEVNVPVKKGTWRIWDWDI